MTRGSPTGVRETLAAVWTYNRFGGMLGLNVGYMLIVVALAGGVGGRPWLFGLFFVAVITMKGQASNADALHDYTADRSNPYKTHVPDAVDTLGRRLAVGLFGGQILVSMAAWGTLTWVTGNPLYLVAGVVSITLGITYSFPPRFKERGVVNHLVTTSVDVCCVLFPGVVLIGGALTRTSVAVLVAVGLYSFAYHVMHQAADTYYDRQVGISTFTQSVGVDRSVLVSFGTAGAAAAAAFCAGLFLLGGVLAGFAVFVRRLFEELPGGDEQHQSDLVSTRFDVARWATALNVAAALNLAFPLLP